MNTFPSGAARPYVPAVGVLYVAGFFYYLAPSASLHLLVAVAAIVFLYCQARILHASKGIPTWRAPQVPWMLVGAGFYEGLGLISIILAIYPESLPISNIIPVAGLALAAFNALVWRNYVAAAKESGVGPLARVQLIRVALKIHLITYLLPAILYMIYLALPIDLPWLLGFAGLLVLAGGTYWKAFLITKACHQQGYALAKFPIAVAPA